MDEILWRYQVDLENNLYLCSQTAQEENININKEGEKLRNKDVVSVLAFEKKLVPSDGFMYGTVWDNRGKETPLNLQVKAVRGTISNRLSTAIQNDPLKLNAKIENPNPQRVDSCALNQEQDTLKLQFTLKILGGLDRPSACNNPEFNQSYKTAVQNYIKRNGLSHLAERYALNLANARFLWRNRVGAESVEVQVKALNEDAEQFWRFDATQYSIRDFDGTDEQVKSLADRIAQALASDDDFLMLEIACYAKVGKAQEVYPSEEMVFEKSNDESKKGKILDAVDGVSAMHSQKIGNAVRTIDTWYPEFDDNEKSAGPIAIEPYGAVTNRGKAYRTPKDKQDFYTFFDRFARG